MCVRVCVCVSVPVCEVRVLPDARGTYLACTSIRLPHPAVGDTSTASPARSFLEFSHDAPSKFQSLLEKQRSLV